MAEIVSYLREDMENACDLDLLECFGNMLEDLVDKDNSSFPERSEK